MVLCLYMLLMKSNLLNIAYSLIQDIEDVSPNLKNNLNEIYPIRFKLDLVGHKDIYCNLDQNKKNISFNKIENTDFEIRDSSQGIFRFSNKQKNK